MKYLNGEYYVKIKDRRYKIHPTENTILQKRDAPKFLKTQYQVQNKTQIRKSQKVISINNNELEVKTILNIKKQLNNNQNINHLIVLVVNKIIGLNFLKLTFVKFVNILSTSKNIKLIKKKFLDKIIIFQLDYHMPIKKKKKGSIRLIPLII